MPFDPIPSAAQTTFTIRVGGQNLPGTFGVISLEIGREIGRIPYAHVILQDGDPAAQTFALSETTELAPGTLIEIDLGYDRNERTVFKGVITRQRIEAPMRGSSRLHVEAKHPCFRMAHARKSRVWVDTSDADALSDLAAAQSLSFEGASDAVRPQLIQHQATDWDFAVMRAERIGQALVAEDDTLRMFTPDPGASPEITLEYGRGLFALDLELDVEAQPRAVEAGAWTPADQALTTGEAAGADVPGPGLDDGATLGGISEAEPKPRHSGARDQAELDEWAAAIALRHRIAAVRGSVETQGAAELAPGINIELKGLGARYNGVAFVSGILHQVTRGDWRSLVQIGLDPRFHAERYDVDGPAAAGLTPCIAGLQIGVVDALEGDPAGEERVAVRIVTETETAEPIWVRPLSIGGGADRGLVFLPEVGDEALLGFLDGDPRDPILLGGVHSSAAANPLPGTDDNHVKGAVSRNGMRIIFNDETVETLIETPNGNRVTLSDDAAAITIADEHGNKIETSRDGVTIESAKDICLSAQNDVKIEGVNLTQKAHAQASLEGSTGASLKSSGQTEITGSLVRIN